MITRIIYTEAEPRLESWLGRSWSKMASLGLSLLLAAFVVMALPRLIAGLIAIAFLAAAAVVLVVTYHLWQLDKQNNAEAQTS